MVGYTKRAGIIIIIIESTKYVLDIFTFFVKHWWNYDKSCLSQWRMRRVFHSFMPHAAVHQEMIRCTPLGVQSVFLQTATIFSSLYQQFVNREVLWNEVLFSDCIWVILTDLFNQCFVGSWLLNALCLKVGSVPLPYLKVSLPLPLGCIFKSRRAYQIFIKRPMFFVYI